MAFNRKEREILKSLILSKNVYPYLAGICSSVAYALVLLAMGHVSNVSYLQAFRQMSLPVGFFAGLLILKEKGTAPKYIGMTLIFAGLVCVALYDNPVRTPELQRLTHLLLRADVESTDIPLQSQGFSVKPLYFYDGRSSSGCVEVCNYLAHGRHCIKWHYANASVNFIEKDVVFSLHLLKYNRTQ